MDPQVTLFEAVGGQPFFDRLVDHFYDAVETDQRLRPMYPDDTGPSRRHLALFLGQYWGGPPVYQEERGHPRLRLRHEPFAIDAVARDRWLEHMGAAVEAMDPDPAIRTSLIDYFSYAAESMRNVAEDSS
jgi:hemoglobin